MGRAPVSQTSLQLSRDRKQSDVCHPSAGLPSSPFSAVDFVRNGPVKSGSMSPCPGRAGSPGTPASLHRCAVSTASDAPLHPAASRGASPSVPIDTPSPRCRQRGDRHRGWFGINLPDVVEQAVQRSAMAGTGCFLRAERASFQGCGRERDRAWQRCRPATGSSFTRLAMEAHLTPCGHVHPGSRPAAPASTACVDADRSRRRRLFTRPALRRHAPREVPSNRVRRLRQFAHTAVGVG